MPESNKFLSIVKSLPGIPDSEILARQNLLQFPEDENSTFDHEFSLIVETMLRAGILQLRFNSVEAAAVLGTNPTTLAEWRRKGTGPKFEFAGGRKFYYLLSDLVRWLADRRRYSSNSQYRMNLFSLQSIQGGI